jgi:hypothetical protein
VWYAIDILVDGLDVVATLVCYGSQASESVGTQQSAAWFATIPAGELVHSTVMLSLRRQDSHYVCWGTTSDLHPVILAR